MLMPCRYRCSGYRWCIGVLALTALAWLQASPDPPSVVLLVEDSASIYRLAATGFDEGFGKSGKVETIFVDAEGKTLAPLLARSSTYEPRLTVAIGTRAAQAAHSRLPGPILYCLALDPERNALAGANIGGFAFEIEVPRQMEEMQKALPRAMRIGVIYDEPVSGRMVRKARQHLNPGVKLVMRDARNPRAAGEIIDSLAGNIDTFWLLWDPVIANPANFRHLVEFSLRNKVALVSPATPFVEAGALMSISADYFETGRNTGILAHKILDGKLRLADLGDKPPAGPLLTVNGEVARRLGIVIPPDLRAEILSPK
jgi:putative tryptophan/tyrosine transport system substrate-binding protein